MVDHYSLDFSTRLTFSIKGKTTQEDGFDWKAACVDAGIISLITFFTGIGTLVSVDALSLNSLVVLLTACGSEFMGMLAMKRGLITTSTDKK